MVQNTIILQIHVVYLKKIIISINGVYGTLSFNKKKVTHFKKNKTIMKQFCLKSESQYFQLENFKLETTQSYFINIIRYVHVHFMYFINTQNQ